MSDDAEIFFKYIANKQQLKVESTLHRDTVKYYGAVQLFLNHRTTDRDRFEEMARLGPRSMVSQMCVDLAKTAKTSTLDKIVCEHEKVYKAYLVKNGLQHAADLRKALRKEQPSFGTLNEREEAAKNADEGPPRLDAASHEGVPTGVPTSVPTGVPTSVSTGVPTDVLKHTAQTKGAVGPTIAPPPPAAVSNPSVTTTRGSVPTSVPTAWQEALAFVRSDEVLNDGKAGFMMIDGNKYTSTKPHPSWVQATYGANVFLGVSFEDSGGKKRKRPWRAKVKAKTIGRFETIVQAAHARALYTQTH